MRGLFKYVYILIVFNSILWMSIVGMAESANHEGLRPVAWIGFIVGLLMQHRAFYQLRDVSPQTPQTTPY
jgi:hypothetical protein